MANHHCKMVPSNPLSDGRSGEYRRRSPAYASAIDAAERAASYITSSDSPLVAKIRTVRNRSAGSFSSHNVTTGHSNGNNSGNLPTSSFLLRVHRQRESLMQRQQREKAFSTKVTALVVIFVVGVIFLFSGGSKGKGGDIGNNNGSKVGVPLPPNVQRQPREQFIRGRNKKHAKVQTVPTVKKEVPNVVSSIEIADDATTNTQQETIHHHSIPPVLIFTYHTNLLTTPEADLAKGDEEDVALSKNVQSIISLHPGSSVRFLTDKDCLESIRKVLPDTNLTTYFTNENHGMYKADICRGAALYETGGMYFDIDIEARMPLWDVVAPQTEFVTTFVHKDSNHPGNFFQAFIGVTPKHPIMKRYLELFVLYYEGELKVNGPLGVYFLRMAYDAIIGQHPDDETIDLWQEVRYTPDLFPDVNRKWGMRRACQMLVVAPPKKSEGFKREQMVPFFSHANGSRMCGGKDTNKKG